MTVINTNVGATITQNALAKNERLMGQAMERLSTGKRINSASDDAAGLAISARMTAQIKGLDQAARNANDAIAMIQTADGASIEVANMLQRMRELAIQSITETNTATDRSNLSVEFVALQDEISRISVSTQWNGENILDGSAGTDADGVVTYQVGANADQTISIELGDWASSSAGVFSNGATEANNISYTAVAAVYTVPAAVIDSEGGVAQVISDGTTSISITQADAASVAAQVTAIQADDDYGDLLFTVAANTAGDALVFTYKTGGVVTDPTVTEAAADVITESTSGTAVAAVYTVPAAVIDSEGGVAQVISDGTTSISITQADAASVAAQVTAIQADDDYGDLLFTVAANTAGDALVFTYKTGGVVTDPTVTEAAADVTVTESTSGTAVAAVYTVPAAVIDSEGGVAQVISDGTTSISITQADAASVAAQVTAIQADDDYGDLLFTVAANTAGDALVFTYKTGGVVTDPTVTEAAADVTVTESSSGTVGISLSTSTLAATALAKIDTAINGINTQRATYGAVMNRLEYVVDNLANVSQNAAASRSRVEDANYAVETTELARTQIIQQAGTAMLAQANQSAQSVLQLLKG